MKISIVVPIYNAERFLRSTLDSLLAQTLCDIEIVCVNDGSSDSSLQILEEYASGEPRVVVVDSVNGGVSRARNKGIEIAKGEYIGFMDADDMATPKMYERLLALAMEHNADIAEMSYCRIPENVQSVSEVDFNSSYLLPGYKGVNVSENPWKSFVALHKKYSGGLVSPIWHRIYKADIAKQCFFLEDIQPGEDTFFNLMAFLRARRYVFSDAIGLLYRQNRVSASNGDMRKVIEKNINAREKVIRYFLENGSRDNESLFKCVTRELVSWPLKMCNKCGTNDDKVHLARRFEQLRKEGVLLLRRLPLSKRFRCFWFLKKYL
ncbi:MAG: glycosyltransferase [Kiritimatiellae bacterium]|nr:glycosyltransferase [Kiritimatiellia bacterium]